MLRIIAFLFALFIAYPVLACDLLIIQQGPINITIQKDNTRYLVIRNTDWNLPIGTEYQLDISFINYDGISSMRDDVTVVDQHSVKMRYARSQSNRMETIVQFSFNVGGKDYIFDKTNSNWVETFCVERYNPSNPFERIN